MSKALLSGKYQYLFILSVKKKKKANLNLPYNKLNGFFLVLSPFPTTYTEKLIIVHLII